MGIMLKTFKYSETSVIAKVYTEKFGLQSYMVNGVYAKNAKNKPAILQPLTILDLVVYHREHKNIQHIKELRPKYLFTTLMTDVVKSALVLFIAEVLYKTLKEETANVEQFDFLSRVILRFDQFAQPASFANLHLWFLVHYARYMGFAPQQNFFYTERPYFNLEDGEFCHRIPTHANYIKLPLSQKLFQLIQLQSDQSEQLDITKSQRIELLHALLNYYKLHVEGFGDLKSVRVLETVFGE